MEKFMKIAVLAVQGAFAEHEKMLFDLGAESIEIRKKSDLEQDFDGLILPGGESTVMGKLIRELGIFDCLREKIENGMPTLGTCAGLILMAKNIAGGESPHLATLPVTVKRNAYGRQLGSFTATEHVSGVGEMPLTFIRAPYVESVEKGVDVIATAGGKIVGVKYKSQIGVAFHPEVTKNTAFHEYFLKICAACLPSGTAQLSSNLPSL